MNAQAWEPEPESVVSEKATRLEERARERWASEVLEILATEFPEFYAAMDEGARAAFAEDLYRSRTAKEGQRKLVAWYYSLAARSHPEYRRHVAEAKAGGGLRYTSEELKGALGL